jgi:hypothetical protein
MKRPQPKHQRREIQRTITADAIAFTRDALDAADGVLDLIRRASADEQPCCYGELIAFVQDHALVPARIGLCQALGTADGPPPLPFRFKRRRTKKSGRAA